MSRDTTNLSLPTEKVRCTVDDPRKWTDVSRPSFGPVPYGFYWSDLTDPETTPVDLPVLEKKRSFYYHGEIYHRVSGVSCFRLRWFGTFPMSTLTVSQWRKSKLTTFVKGSGRVRVPPSLPEMGTPLLTTGLRACFLISVGKIFKSCEDTVNISV